MNRRYAPVSLALFLALAACGGSSTNAPPGDVGVLAPDFALTDVNAASPTATQDVSPRDYVGKVSAWYFGHAT